ncbi:MAG: hypothetical protein ACYTGC_05685 [Planctomycetota bacterium]|jgi:hypothetical protein
MHGILHALRLQCSATPSCWLGLVIAGAAVTPVAAEGVFIEWKIIHVPDFDQRRTALPNSGNMYCVPTSASNWTAYLANHGYPTMGVPGNWQDQSRYNDVSNRIEIKGILMNTDPGDPDPDIGGGGTSGSNAKAGLETWIDAIGEGENFLVTQFYADDEFAPLYTNLVVAGLNGGLVMLRYGRYVDVPPPPNAAGGGLFARTGGHVTSLVGSRDYFLPTASVRWRDPASDEGNLNTQSTFTTNSSDVVNVTAIFDGHERTQSRLVDFNSGPRFIDGYTAIWPKFGLTTCCDEIALAPVNPIPFSPGFDPPAQIVFPNTLLDICVHPELTRYFALTAAVAGGAKATLWEADPLTGESNPVLTPPNPVAMAFGRRGELYLVAEGGASLLVIHPDADPPLQFALSLPAPVDALDYDDLNDEVICLSSATSQVLRIPFGEDPGITPMQIPPDSVLLAGECSIAVDPTTRHYWLASTESSLVYALAPGSAPGMLTVARVIDTGPPPTAGSDSIQVDRHGHVRLSRGGQLVEYEPSEVGWVLDVDSPFQGLPVGKILCMARGRTNWNPKTMTGPAHENFVPTEFPTPEPDCAGDVNGDLFVNVDDLLEVILGWGCTVPPGPCPGDVNMDLVVNVDDLLLIILNWGACFPT